MSVVFKEGKAFITHDLQTEFRNYSGIEDTQFTRLIDAGYSYKKAYQTILATYRLSEQANLIKIDLTDGDKIVIVMDWGNPVTKLPKAVMVNRLYQLVKHLAKYQLIHNNLALCNIVDVKGEFRVIDHISISKGNPEQYTFIDPKDTDLFGNNPGIYCYLEIGLDEMYGNGSGAQIISLVVKMLKSD